MNKEKYIGESALNDKPGKKINLMIRDGSITTSKLADGSVTTEKLADGAVSKEKLDPTIHQEIIDSVTASNEATEKAKEATVKANQATAAATVAKEAADTATQLATTATAASVQATEQAKAATTKAEEATAKANEATQKADDSREQTEQTLGTMQEVIDKTAIKDEEGALVETPFRYIQNEEFIFAKVDAEDKLLFGIQWDGTPKFGKTSAVEDRLQSQVTLLAERVSTIMGDEDTTNVIDTMNELKKFFAEIENTQTLTGILANLDNVAKNLDKTTIKDEEGNVQDTPFRVIENEEFIKAIVDSEDKVLFGFRRDAGKPYYPLNEMYHVEQNEEFFAVWLDAANHVLLGIRRDGEIIGEIHTVYALKQVVSQLQSDLTTLQEKVGTMDASLQELLDVFSLQDNKEFLAVEQDAEGKILSSTNPDGSHYIHNAKSETIPTEFSHIEDQEGRTEITTDAEERIMSYRDSQGKKHEHDMEVTNLEVSNLNLQGNSVYNIQDALEANGFTVKTPADWSEYITKNGDYPLNIPTPRCARLNIISSSDLTKLSKVGLAGAVKGKNYDIPAVVEFWDMQGNYFKKNSYISGQGSSSMNYIKKSIALDLFDSEVGGDSFSVKFGEWVPQDSFHLKAYYTDPFRGMCVIGYSIYNDIVKTRGLEKDYVWKRALLNTDAITPTNPIVDGKKEVLLYTESGARCFPDGFPCMVFQNGEFWGLYSFQLKKHRSNYCLNKKTAEHIHLDGNISETSLFNANGDSSLIQWKNIYKVGFEIRNPKSLYLMDGSEYDADLNSGELIDETSEFYDELKHKTSAKVKKYIIDFSKTLATIKAAEDVYLGNKTDENLKAIKYTLETYFDSENLIDYLITCDLLRNTDGFADNWQWVTYNGVKWYVCLYDVDATLGNHWQPVQTINPPLDGKHVTQIISKISMMKYITTYYVSELEERYAYLRKNGIIDAERIVTKIRDWMLRFGGQYAYELEANKWTDFVKNDNIFRVHKWLITEINNLDKVYHYNSEV